MAQVIQKKNTYTTALRMCYAVAAGMVVLAGFAASVYATSLEKLTDSESACAKSKAVCESIESGLKAKQDAIVREAAFRAKWKPLFENSDTSVFAGFISDASKSCGVLMVGNPAIDRITGYDHEGAKLKVAAVTAEVNGSGLEQVYSFVGEMREKCPAAHIDQLGVIANLDGTLTGKLRIVVPQFQQESK